MDRFRLPLLLVLWVFLAGCREDAKIAAATPTVIEQWSGQQSSVTRADTRTMRDAKAWDATWKEIGQTPPRPLRAAREMAVAIFLGERRTGGYSVEFIGSRIGGGNVIVEYREKTPEPGAMVAQAITSPWVVTIVPKSDLPVTFRNASSAPSKK